MFTIPDPLRVAEGTYLVRPLIEQPPDVGGGPRSLHVNSLIIVGAEPVLVDTGAATVRDEWLEQTFALVDPCDVRWIFLSHADPDHVGNLPAALELCPSATVVTTWPSHHHVGAALGLPAERRRHLAHGEVLELADRRLVAVRPPVFDAPTTCGLYDASTGVYWSADAFGAAVPDLVDDVGDLQPDEWLQAADEYAVALSPWTAVADQSRYDGWVDGVASLSPSVIASAHGPLVLGTAVDVAIQQTRCLPRRGDSPLHPVG